MADLTHVPHTPKIDLRGLVDEPYADAVDLANNVVAKVFDAPEDWMIGPHAHMPIEWRGCGGGDGHNGPAVDEPTTIYMALPLAGYDDAVVYRTSVIELVQEMIDGGFVKEAVCDGGDGAFVKELSAALRKIADTLDIELDLAVEAEFVSG